jgi:hypothetical protein
VDAIYLATPNFRHAELAIPATADLVFPGNRLGQFTVSYFPNAVDEYTIARTKVRHFFFFFPTFFIPAPPFFSNFLFLF